MTDMPEKLKKTEDDFEGHKLKGPEKVAATDDADADFEGHIAKGPEIAKIAKGPEIAK